MFNKQGVELNGVILISVAMSFQTIATEKGNRVFHPGNDLPFPLHLPTYTATAWYHGQLDEEHQASRCGRCSTRRRSSPSGEYATALLQGDQHRPADRDRVLDRLQRAHRARSRPISTCYDLQDPHHALLQGAARAPSAAPLGASTPATRASTAFADGDVLENDPSGDQMMGQFTSALNDLLRTELGYENDSFYKSLSMKVNESWDYEEFKNHYVNTSESLRDVLVRSPRTRVFVANGYYDLATPHFATEYTFNHMGLDPSRCGTTSGWSTTRPVT